MKRTGTGTGATIMTITAIFAVMFSFGSFVFVVGTSILLAYRHHASETTPDPDRALPSQVLQNQCGDGPVCSEGQYCMAFINETASCYTACTPFGDECEIDELCVLIEFRTTPQRDPRSMHGICIQREKFKEEQNTVPL